MALLTNPAFGPRIAFAYVTIGSLIDVWTAVYYWVYVRGVDQSEVPGHTWFWLLGLFLTGLTLILLGIIIGPLGQYARKAELPPPEAQQAEAAIQQTGAAHPPPVVAGAAGGVAGAPAAVPVAGGAVPPGAPQGVPAATGVPAAPGVAAAPAAPASGNAYAGTAPNNDGLRF